MNSESTSAPTYTVSCLNESAKSWAILDALLSLGSEDPAWTGAFALLIMYYY